MQDIFYYSKGSLTVTSKILDWTFDSSIKELTFVRKNWNWLRNWRDLLPKQPPYVFFERRCS